MSRTKIQLNLDESAQITYNQAITTIGSCFSNCIGNRLIHHKFNVLCNPFGVIFNPISIFKLIEDSHKQSSIDKHLFLERDEKWLHHNYHSDLNADSKEELNTLITNQLKKTHKFLNQSNTLILTFGTAFVHRHTNSKSIVANCHKVPSSNFQKELLNQEQIVEAFKRIHKLLSPNIRVILTVSPVRHTREGLSQNMESKAILRTTCGELERDFDNVHYFPAFEIMMDDLRDYRYYKPDLIHPTEEAEEIIYNHFINSTLFSKDLETYNQVVEINRLLNHKPFNPKSASHKKFVNETINKMKRLDGVVDYSAEILKAQNDLSL